MKTVIIRRLHGVHELEDARRVCDAVWPSTTGGTEITKNLLTAMEHSGGYVAAAYLSEAPTEPVGAVIAFLGRHRNHGGVWQVHLHSHMTAVLDRARDRNIGTLLKRDQREWALENDIETIRWTFDPLVRRNARLNLLKLGVEVSEYLVNFYGDMDDELNHGDESDRMMASWRLRSDRVLAAMASQLRPLAELPAGSRVIPLPRDIVEIRKQDPAAAAGWRREVRSQILAAMADGLVLTGLDANDSYIYAPKAD